MCKADCATGAKFGCWRWLHTFHLRQRGPGRAARLRRPRPGTCRIGSGAFFARLPRRGTACQMPGVPAAAAGRNTAVGAGGRRVGVPLQAVPRRLQSTSLCLARTTHHPPPIPHSVMQDGRAEPGRRAQDGRPRQALHCVKKDSLFAAARGRQQVVVVHGRGERERTLGCTVSVTLPRTPLRRRRPARTTDRTLHPHTQTIRTASLPLGGPRVAICISAW